MSAAVTSNALRALGAMSVTLCLPAVSVVGTRHLGRVVPVTDIVRLVRVKGFSAFCFFSSSFLARDLP